MPWQQGKIETRNQKLEMGNQKVEILKWKSEERADCRRKRVIGS
jgi:hypothetical protein